MDPKNLVKDVARVQAALRQVGDSLVTTVACAIYLPVRFSERGLASVSVEVYVVGIYALVMESAYYAVSMVNALVRIDPLATNKVSIDGDEFFEFVFNPGSVVIPSVQLVKQSTITYRIYDELINKGRIPWYLKYAELAKLFDTARKHAGANIGADHEVTELLISMISRDPEDRTKYYRSTVKSVEDLVNHPPVFIPLKSVTYSATNTTTKLSGSFMQDGIVSALVSPSERNERIESLLIR